MSEKNVRNPPLFGGKCANSSLLAEFPASIGEIPAYFLSPLSCAELSITHYPGSREPGFNQEKRNAH